MNVKVASFWFFLSRYVQMVWDDVQGLSWLSPQFEWWQHVNPTCWYAYSHLTRIRKLLHPGQFQSQRNCPSEALQNDVGWMFGTSSCTPETFFQWDRTRHVCTGSSLTRALVLWQGCVNLVILTVFNTSLYELQLGCTGMVHRPHGHFTPPSHTCHTVINYKTSSHTRRKSERSKSRKVTAWNWMEFLSRIEISSGSVYWNHDTTSLWILNLMNLLNSEKGW